MIRILTLLLLFASICPLSANNVVVSTPDIVVRDASAPGARPQDSVYLAFDVRWDNSWRFDVDPMNPTQAPFNRDAVWVFFKFRDDSGIWRHATLRDLANSRGNGPDDPVIEIMDNKGAMIYRSDNGTGNLDYDNIQINWNYAADGNPGSTTNEDIEVQVFAIEMVYIPTGNFFLGSGAEAPTDFSDPLNPSNPENAELNEFYRYDAGDTDARTPFSVLNEGEILVGQNTGQLYYQNTNNRGGDRLDIPAGFPKGHAAFYLQKYETTQQQWVSFFNTLTVQQKANRDITGDPGKDSDLIVDRNAIEWDGAGDASIIGGSGTETNKDREYVAIGLNYVSQQDMLAYLDWAALRPMTELEFEKAARGTLNSERNEYVWGTPRVTTEENNLLNDVKRSAEEAVGVNAYPDITTPGPRIGMANYTEAESSSAGERGPFRAGIFAGSPQNPNPNDRINTGAGYYGNMELAGNLLEGVVNVGRAQGLAFRNINGDGELDANGNANVPTWPNSTDGLSVRGGAFDSEDILLHTSDRSLGVTFSTSRGHTSRRRNLQFRGVRGL